MKKLALAALLAVVALAPIASMADPIATPLGVAEVRDNGDGTAEVYADGDAANPDPLDGYAGVEIDTNAPSATLVCSDEGGWDDVDAEGNSTRAADCNPQP